MLPWLHTPAPSGTSMPFPVPTHMRGSVSMDLVTARPETASSNFAIVVFVDRLSKMTHPLCPFDLLSALYCMFLESAYTRVGILLMCVCVWVSVQLPRNTVRLQLLCVHGYNIYNQGVKLRGLVYTCVNRCAARLACISGSNKACCP